LPVDVALLLDVSGSMGAPLPLIKQAALGFVNQLRADDRAAVVGFARHFRLHEGLTTDRQALSTAVHRLDPNGPTALFDALYVMAQQLERDRAESRVIRRQAIVVLSDGHDTASHVSFDDAMTAVRRTGATTYTIAPQPVETGNPDKDGGKQVREAEFYLRALARDTGGRAFLISERSTLVDIYATVAAELRHQYTLAFRPERRKSAGVRQVDVRLASHPGATIRTRRTYETSR
jgi:Ca-activated chloride channel family protein